MNRSDLIAKMTERLDGDRAAATAAVNGVLEEIEGSVARGERVSLTGFGTFERRERPPRTARNPRTGETIRVGASVVPVFRAGAGFRTLLSQNGSEPTAGPADDGAPRGEAGESAPATSAITGAVASAGEGKAGKKARAGAGEKGAEAEQTEPEKPKAGKGTKAGKGKAERPKADKPKADKGKGKKGKDSR